MTHEQTPGTPGEPGVTRAELDRLNARVDRLAEAIGNLTEGLSGLQSRVPERVEYRLAGCEREIDRLIPLVDEIGRSL